MEDASEFGGREYPFPEEVMILEELQQSDPLLLDHRLYPVEESIHLSLSYMFHRVRLVRRFPPISCHLKCALVRVDII